MAGDWLKMRVSLRDDPRVVRIAAMLKAEALFRPDPQAARVLVIGGLFRLWCIADQHSETGELPGYSRQDMNDEIGIPGFAEAVESVGWLEVFEGGMRIPRFLEHNGESAKKRAVTARRQSRYRSRNARVTPVALPREEKRDTGGGFKGPPLYPAQPGAEVERIKADRQQIEPPNDDWIQAEIARNGLLASKEPA